MGGQGSICSTPKHCSRAGVSQGVGIPIGNPLHKAADTLWLSRRNAGTFTKGLGKFEFKTNVLPGKRKKRLFSEEKKKKGKINPPDASQLCFLVLLQGQRWQLAACGCLCSAPKATGQGQEALKGSQFRGWEEEGNCK